MMMTSDTIDGALSALRRLLDRYTFRPTNEADLRDQVVEVIGHSPVHTIYPPWRFTAAAEVIAEHGRYDILVNCTGATCKRDIVLELKLSGSAAAVERQAQRYAKTEGIDAVIVVTTSQRLAKRLRPAVVTNGLVGRAVATLGGKPFDVITLRAF